MTNGLAWRPARGRRAGQSDIGDPREAGRASRLLWKMPERSTRLTKDQARDGVSPSGAQRSGKRPQLPYGEMKRATGTDEGSLSVCIVAVESGETFPREPTSSQGGHRMTDPLLGNTERT